MSSQLLRYTTMLALAAFAALAGCPAQRPAPPEAPGAGGEGGDVAGAAVSRDEVEVGAEAPTPRPRVGGPGVQRVGLVRHSGSGEGPIPYAVVEPPHGPDDLPLVIALHGRGDNAEGFSGLAEQVGLPVRTIVARAPLRYGGRGGRQWYESGAADEAAQVRARAADLLVLADQLAARYPTAPRPALYGFSQGAVVALQAAVDHPERWSAVVALSGYLATADGASRVVEGPPVLVVAGSRDGVIPAERSWDAATALEALGHRTIRFGFDGPHRIPPVALERFTAFLREHLLTPDLPREPDRP